MTSRIPGIRRFSLVSALAVLPLAAPLPAAAQFGAIAMVPDGQTTPDGVPLVIASSPLLAESAMILPRGRMGIGGWAATSDGFSLYNGGLSYSPTDRLMLGATVTHYDLEGANWDPDLDVSAKFQLWRSPDFRSIVAASGVAGTDGSISWFGLGGAVSHVLDQISLHGSLRVTSYTSDLADWTGTSFSAAAVVPVRRQLWLSGSAVGHSWNDGEIAVFFAPGARVGLGRNVFIDGGAVMDGESTALMVGLTLVP